jgi:hypothetical protein
MNEKSALPIPDIHYTQVNEIIAQFEKDITTPDMVGGSTDGSDVRTQTALNFIGQLQRDNVLHREDARAALEELYPMVKNGTYSNLTTEVYNLRKLQSNPDKFEQELIGLAKKYTSKIKRKQKNEVLPLQPQIIISETFL